MDYIEFLKSVTSYMGSSGYPLAFKEDYRNTWEAFSKTYPNPTSLSERFLQVISFMQYMSNAGVQVVEKAPKLPVRFNAKDLYIYALQLQIAEVIDRNKEISRKLQIGGLLVVKYKSLQVSVSDKVYLSYAVALAPKRKESLDSVLFKLSGSAFPEVPPALAERYKRSGNSRTAAKSAHSNYRALFTSPSNIGRFPIVVDGQRSITLARSSEALLVLRYQYELPRFSVFWMTKHSTTKLVEALFKKVVK